jgi:hypothetical protein
MQQGTQILLHIPPQPEDLTGLKELESRYAMAGEISALLDANE